MSLQIPITGDLTGLQAALRNIPGVVGNAMGAANAAGSRAFGGLFSGLRSSVTNFAGFMKSSLVNAVGALGIVQSFRSTLNQLDKVGDLADRFGISTEALQRLGGVAELSGASMESMAKALSRLGRTAGEALADPASQAAQKFADLGLSVDQLKGKNVEEIFDLVRPRISEMTSEVEQGTVAFGLFGRGGEEIRNVLQLTGDEFEQLSGSINVAAEDIVRSAQTVDDAIKKTQNNLTVAVGTMLSALEPFILFFSKALSMTFAGLNILVTSGMAMFGKATMAQVEQAVEMAKRIDADTFKAKESVRQKTAAPASETAGPSAVPFDGSLPQPQRDPAEAVRARMGDIISSGRGIEPARIIADSLAQIAGGGSSVLVGRGDEEQKRLLQQQLSALQKIENNTREIDVATLR